MSEDAFPEQTASGEDRLDAQNILADLNLKVARAGFATVA
jgi:hypothetical protein